MTNKEAIEILKQTGGVINPMVHPVKNYTASQVYEAVDLAIKALEDRPQGEWIKESIPVGGFGDTVLVITCSICKTSFVYRGKMPNFCSKCGTKMVDTDNGT